MSYKIRGWKASYYQNDQNRWVHGQLTCSPSDVSFCQEKATDSQLQSREGADSYHELPYVNIKYTDIKMVQKAKSMLIFKAIIIETNTGTVHWFSSLPDQYSLYNTLDYFVRHNLLDSKKERKEQQVDPASQTYLGQQLLKSAEDSERTLASAAADLHGQGRQLVNASIQLQEIHEDLDVADHLLSGLNTYLGKWSLPEQYVHEEPIHISQDDVSSDHDVEVLCSEMRKDQWQWQQLCLLRVTESGMTLLTSRQRLVHTLRWTELSRVFVVSPWEVVLTKHVAGKPDTSVSMVGAALLPVLQLLQKKVSHLMDYQTPPPAPKVEAEKADRGQTQVKVTSTHTGSVLHGSNSGRCVRPSKAHPGLHASDEQMKQSVESQGMSDAELHLLTNKLGTLKAMACAVENELTSQNRELDDMIESVEHADSRVRDVTQRTKALM